MPQSLARMLVHVIFSTKHREPFLHDAEIRDRLHAYLAQICNENNSHARIVGGVSDHVHILCDLSRTCCLADLVAEVKRSSSKWLKSQGNVLSKFSWQNGYGAFSVSQSQLNRVTIYIRDQEAHHAQQSFQQEYRGLLRKHGIEFDERYVWD
jgi:REP element-mobilizing transposase RayT